MEEMIDQDLIKKLRSERCWSQEHLALASGISLRTVQRIETHGKCSLDSRKALAATFDLDVADLSVNTTITLSSDNDCKREAAISWLELVDSGEYGLSWQNAAPLFKDRISSTEWVKALKQIRKPFGKVTSRSIKTATKHNSLPGVPDGQYIVVKLITSYERKQSSVETVTLSRESNGWRVAGYFIK